MPDPAIRVVAMPRDANPDGDVFGGWLLSQMDIAGYIPARKLAKNRVVTVAMEQIQFHHPVRVGDCVECYSHIEKIGRTSIRVKVEAYVDPIDTNERLKVTEGYFVFVSIDQNRKPVVIPVFENQPL
jgi:acyl-CoA thioesterase YciA